VLTGPDTRLEQARALADLGALLRRTNHRVEGRPLLRQAVDAAHHIGATALARRAQTELRAAGARPRRVLLTGLEALTASERRIAELDGEGLTNRQIAKPCSSPPEPSKATSPTCSKSSTSTPAPP
jgi:DNA-binding NarL/FixJ family response regulator